MFVSMHLYEGFGVCYNLVYCSNIHAADTSAASFTNESIALIVQVRHKRSGLEPLITSMNSLGSLPSSCTLNHTNGAC